MSTRKIAQIAIASVFATLLAACTDSGGSGPILWRGHLSDGDACQEQRQCGKDLICAPVQGGTGSRCQSFACWELGGGYGCPVGYCDRATLTCQRECVADADCLDMSEVYTACDSAARRCVRPDM